MVRFEQEALHEYAALRGAGDSRFQMLADAAPIPLWTTGPDTLCTFVNRPWLEFRGRTLEQELGEGRMEGVHPEDRDGCLRRYLTAFRNRQPFHMEYRVLRADGEYRWVLDSGVPIFDAGNSFHGYAGTAVDITSRRGYEPRQVSLTEREEQVMILIAQGKSTREVGNILGITYKTADSHRSNLMDKLDIHETASLVRYAIRAGLVEP